MHTITTDLTALIKGKLASVTAEARKLEAALTALAVPTVKAAPAKPTYKRRTKKRRAHYGARVAIRAALPSMPSHFTLDDLRRAINMPALPAGTLSDTLTILAQDGLVTRVGTNRYIPANRSTRMVE